MERKRADIRAPQAVDADYEKMGRDALIALLRSVMEQRDDVLSKYEAMAFQVDESTREIDDAALDARRNAKKAEYSEHHAEAEATHASELQRLLDEERRKSAAIAADFARLRAATTKPPVEDPWGQLGRAASQILSDGLAWTRAKIPPDSRLLPWFDKTVEGGEKAGRFAWKMSRDFYGWAEPRAIEAFERAKPRAIEGWKWARGEVERRMSKAKE
jgi:hypothetical protein